MRKKFFLPLVLVITITQAAIGQQPKYTKKHFASVLDTIAFKPPPPSKDGFKRYFIVSVPEIWDTDDDNTTHIRGGGVSAVICIEGMFMNGKKNGTFGFFVIDSLDQSKKYKLWEQTYVNDKLNGEWKTYNLKGTVIKIQTFKEVC